jgi:hypothetical protein
MKWSIWLLLAVVNLAGCSGLQRFQSGVVQRFSSENRLSAAVQHLEQGKTADATMELEKIVNGPGVEGVTDEALFRLSLLLLRQSQDKEPATATQQLLERLKKEYPNSQWARLALPLADHLVSEEELKRQYRNLRILNLSLAKDNKELQSLKSTNQTLLKENRDLHQSIERLKNLDIELEKKSR